MLNYSLVILCSSLRNIVYIMQFIDYHLSANIFFQQAGHHVDHVVDPLVTKLIEIVKKKNKGGINIKPFQVCQQFYIYLYL